MYLSNQPTRRSDVENFIKNLVACLKKIALYLSLISFILDNYLNLPTADKISKH